MSALLRNGIGKLEEFSYLGSVFFLASRPCSSLNEFNKLFDYERKIKCIERLKQFRMSHKPTLPSTQENAAVLVPLCHVNNEVSLLYTLRKQNLKRHKGQVSFPGGKQDPQDKNVEITALRETEEELGIHQTSVDVWGHGNIIVGKEFNICPVVGYVGNIDVDNLKLNSSEVELAFTVPLKHFCNPLHCKYTQYQNGNGYILPVYINSKCKIWGITALITHIVLQSLIPKVYRHKIKLIQPLFP